MNTTIRACALLVACIYIAAATVSASEFIHDRSEQILWKSDNQSRAEIPGAVAGLYTSLYNTNQLPLRKVTVSKGQSVEQAMRDAGVITGPYYPVELDALLCDLNRDYCRRELIPADPAKFDDPTAHIGGYEFSRGSWFNPPDVTLDVPSIEFDLYEEFGVGWKNAGESIEDIIRSRGVTCEQFGVDCYEAVKIFNRSNPEVLEVGYEGYLVLPVRGVSTYISLEHDQELLEEEAESLESAPEAPELYMRQMPEYVKETEKWQHSEEKAFEAIKQKSVTWGESKRLSDPKDEPLFTTQENLFKLINHPALQSDWHPGMDWSKSGIAVLDSWVDNSHCDIGTNIEVHNETDGSPTPSGDDSQCGQIETANPIEHHGTHVTALLGGSLNYKGIGGLLPPESKVYTHEVKHSRLANASYRQQVSQHIMLIAVQQLPKTFNLSWYYKNELPGLDVIENAIQVMQGMALVVVPAGNDSDDFNAGDCSLLPACFYKYPNVITVVGLDRDEDHPQLWVTDNGGGRGSSFASFFHVGAIAQNVLSATKSHKHGTLSGTSQAAPQVSATAGYLWALIAASSSSNPDPQDIKNRIIYTADYFPHLRNKVLGGRLNMAKAVDISTTSIVTRDGSSISGVFNGYQGATGGPADIVILRDGGMDITVAFDDLKRLILDPSGTSYVAYFTDDNGVLVRKAGVTLQTLSQEIHIIPPGSAVATKVALSQIADYVAEF